MDQPLTAAGHPLTGPATRPSPRTRAAALASALALAGLLTACGGGSGDTEDKGKPSESASSQDDGGSMTIEGEDGSLTVDEDEGTVTVEGEDGSATFSAGGTELPDGWPAEVPVAEGTIIFAQSSTIDGASTFSASVETSDSPEALYSAVRAAITEAGFEKVTEVTAQDGSFATFSGNGWDVLVTVGSSEAGATVIYAVTPTS